MTTLAAGVPLRLARARGVLLGQAAGDALGTTVEFESAEAIRRRYPSGLRDIEGGGPFGVKRGQVTDDTELALALARSLARRGRYDADDVAASYLAWRASDPFDCGQATHQAFRGGLSPGPGLATAVQRRASPTTEANGSLMRVSPLGVFGWRLEPEALAEVAAQDARLSHPRPRCQAAGVVFTHAIAHALRTGDDGPATWAATVAFARRTALAEPVLEDLLAAERALPPDFLTHEGWVRIAFGAAFFHLARGSALEEAVVDVVNRGGDTDTNGCITGALLGAVGGEAAVPARWTDAVLTCAPDRPPAYHCTDLLELADALAGP